jgi:hypothetical protein
MRPLALVAAAIALATVSAPAFAQETSFPSDQVRSEYAPPKNPEHQQIHDILKERQALERLSELLSPLRLPRKLTLKVEGCDGSANAFYWEDAVVICYEYLEYVRQNAPTQTTPVGLSPNDYLIGPTVDVFLHEAGHAVFDILEVPVFGREEDAADLFSAYIMLNFSTEDARRLMAGVAFLGNKEAMAAQTASPTLKAFADAHGLPAQRYFNVLCMAYGRDSAVYADAVKRGGLSEERAEGCADEYASLELAFRKLIRPYIDQERLSQVRAKSWFRFDPPAPTAR